MADENEHLGRTSWTVALVQTERYRLWKLYTPVGTIEQYEALR